MLNEANILAQYAISSECMANIRMQLTKGTEPLKSRPIIRLSQWAHDNFYLSAESSQKKQKWEAYPFQIGWLDWMGDRQIEEYNCIKSARVGYTKCLLACIGFDAEYERRNQVVYQPTDDDRDSFTKTEIDPMLADTQALQKVLPYYQQRHKDNTTKLKKFFGSLLHILGGKAAKNYRRITVASVKFDEIDGFDQQIEGSSDPVTLGKKRLEGATFPKLLIGSTPRVAGLSHIEGRVKLASVIMQYHIPCPHCNEHITLQWGGTEVNHGFKFDLEQFAHGGESDVQHICIHCGVGMTQAEYLSVWQLGQWRSTNGQYRYNHHAGHWTDANDTPTKPPRHVASHIWTAYSPQATWADIVREFYSAVQKKKSGDKAPLIGFVNETLGETWKDDDIEQLEYDKLKERAEPYPLCTVPVGGLVLVAGIDVQGNRFEITVWAYGRGEEMWAIDYHVIEANPSLESEWLKVDEYLLHTTFTHQHGQPMRIEVCAIDMMGHFTQQGYNFVRVRGDRAYAKCYGVRGDPQGGKPISGRASLQDVTHKGKLIKGGAKLYFVGTDTAKDLLHGRLYIEQKGAGYVHFSDELPIEFYKQLTAEMRILQKTPTGYVYKWVKPNGARNEVLDTTVYAMFCAHRIGLHQFADKMWTRLEQALAPDLFAQAEAQTEPKEIEPAHPTVSQTHKPTRHRRNQGVSKSW